MLFVHSRIVALVVTSFKMSILTHDYNVKGAAGEQNARTAFLVILAQAKIEAVQVTATAFHDFTSNT